VLGLLVEALPDEGLKVSGAFGVETPVWENVRTSRRFFAEANPTRFRFTLISKNGEVETTFGLDS
jgi:hypothetical protein